MSSPKIGRKSDYRNRTVRNLATSLVLYEKIVTTTGKAKLLRPMVERLITHIRKNDLSARRYAKALLFDDGAVRKLFEDFPSRLGERESGFVRLTKCPFRPGDGAQMVSVELLLTPLEVVVAKENSPKKSSKKAKVTEENLETGDPAQTNQSEAETA